ncbi:unnamed protein product [Lepidochelys kempii]
MARPRSLDGSRNKLSEDSHTLAQTPWGADQARLGWSLLSSDHTPNRWVSAMWGWALLPILLAICGTVGFWVVYAMSVANGSVNVTVMFPYISECLDRIRARL